MSNSRNLPKPTSMMHVYFIATMQGIALVFLLGVVHPIPFGLIGSGSIHAAFGQMAFPDSQAIVTPAVCWFLVFPPLLIMVYILSLVKKWCIPFLVIMVADVGVVIIYCAWCYLSNNSYGGNVFLFDGLFSLLYAKLYISAVRNKNDYENS